MTRQGEAWYIGYRLTNATDGMTVARGRIKDYPSAAEALDRLGERVATAVAAELLPLADPAPWKLVLTFEVCRTDSPPPSLAAAARSAAAVDAEADTAEMMTPAAGQDSGIDLATCLDDDAGG